MDHVDSLRPFRHIILPFSLHLTGDTLIRLGFNNDPAPSFVLPSMYDLVCTNITIAG